jgi:hypothetical protein
MKKTPGRPRIHEVGKWTSIQFRIPIELRTKLLSILDEKNTSLPYRLSLNSLLLELVALSIKEKA